MNERNSWEIEQSKQTDARQNRQLDDHEERIRVLETFRNSTIEKLITIFNTLEEIRDGNKWIRRLVSSALITGIIGGVITAVFRILKG